jgi:long-chain fatty acid transport protein
VTKGHRIRLRRLAPVLTALGFLIALPALPSGFQLMSQGARASGMGLAFTAVANDPSAIFFNPAGIAFEKHFDISLGSSFITRTKGDFDGADPYPGVGVHEDLHKTTFTLPTVYLVAPLTSEVNLGLGIFAPYGLGFRWDNAENCGGDCAKNPVSATSFSGRFVGQNTYIQTTDINPVISYQAAPQFAIALGADYRLSKVMLERNEAAINPFTNSAVDIAHVKLNSDLTDNHGWGWNAGILYKPSPQLSFGASYRSRIKVDYDGTATFAQRFTGNGQFDAVVASELPKGSQKASTAITFPETVNLGAAVGFAGGFLLSLEADWTRWSRFNELLVTFPGTSIPALDRKTNWDDSWAYRAGLEKKFTNWAIRAGYYRDKTPQPVADVGPLLADNDRDAFTLGFGYDTPTWGVNVGDIYIKVKSRDTSGSVNNDGFYGKYHEDVNVFALDLRLSF